MTGEASFEASASVLRDLWTPEIDRLFVRARTRQSLRNRKQPEKL